MTSESKVPLAPVGKTGTKWQSSGTFENKDMLMIISWMDSTFHGVNRVLCGMSGRKIQLCASILDSQ